MKILHVTAYHSSSSTGGTEVYIDSLAEAFAGHDVDSTFWVLNNKAPKYELPNVRSMCPVTGISDLKAQIKEYFIEARPFAIFIHTSDTWEYLVGDVARELKIPYFYFFHAPYWLCYQRNLRFFDKKPCFKLFNPWRCAVCRSGRGSCLRGIVAVLLLENARRWGFCQNSALHAYKAELAQKERLIRNADRVVVFTERDRLLFQKNGFPEADILVIPQELGRTRLDACLVQSKKVRSGCPRFGYIGRCCEIKGCDILVDAALKLPANLEFELCIYGCDWTDPYCRKLRTMSAQDPRIRLFETMPPEEIPDKLGALDVLCIPSLVFETGPLTLREGVYSGCYVAGSDQVGQIDFLLQHGRLITHNNATAWADFLRDCVSDIGAIRRKRKTNFSEVKCMESVATRLLFELRQPDWGA